MATNSLAGAVGEMLVEGPTLARGYLNNPEKTAEAFIYAPSWATDTNEAGEKRRFYKSGDLVRYNSAQGALTYIGRKDTQVKLHGQRVELGEIESRLTADVDIQLAVVYVPKSGYAQGKLVTVFCFAGANHTEARELLLEHASEQRITGLRQRIGTVLPTYMVPGIWLSVESLPLLSSGKLDRKKVARWLEEMEEDPQFTINGDEEVDPSLYTPANETEKLLAEAWSRVLNIPVHRLKLTESFLKLGGDSLTAMTCTNLCKRAGLGVTVQDILRRPSIRDLALHTSAIETPTSYEEKLEEKFDLSPIQYLHSLVRTEGQSYFNQSIQTRVQQTLSEPMLRGAISALVARHGMLRARFSLEGPEQKMQQRITAEIESSFRLNCQSVQNGNLVDHVISTSQQSINCFVGPLLSVDLIDVPGKGQILSLVGHHLVVDIVSFRLILSDLEELLLQPGKATVPTPSMPYQMWTAKQLQEAEADIESATEFDSAPPHNFDFWGVDNDITYGQVKCSTFEVSQESTSLLLTGCHESLNTETVDLLLACMLHSFADAFPNGPTPVINNEGHGREPWDPSIDISRTVGWFTTLYPIWMSDISGSQDLLQTVACVKDMRRRATDNGRAFFAHRTLTASGRDRFPHPVPMEMSFNYLGQNRDLQNQKGLFHLADTMVGESREGGGAADYGRQTPRFALFEISAAVIEGQLRFTFSYGKSILHQDKVQTWLKNCHTLLEKLPHQLLAAPPTKTVSDFPMLKMNHDELEHIESGILPRYGITSLHAVEEMYPCTRMQQGILLSRCRNPLLYAVHTTFEVRGMGSVQETTRGILAAWSKLISHHSMLRTIFVDRLTSKTPFGQVVLKDIGYAEPAQLSCEDEDQVLSTFASRDIVPYHDSHRFSVCSVNHSGKVFCRLEMNHAAMDGASISILLRDLKSACTKSFAEGAKPEFKEFAKHAQKQTSLERMKFWTSYLDGARPCHIQLNPKGNNLANRSSIRTSRIELKDYSRLNSFCEAEGITQSTVFNVAWGLLLAFLTQSDDVSFAYTTSLRDAPIEGIDAMVGPVMNLNVCRIKLSAAGAGLSLLDVLQKTQGDFAASLPHRACSLIDVLHEMKQGDKSLFNSGVSYRKLPPQAKDSGSDAIEFIQKGFIHDPAETAVYVNVEATDKSASIELNHWTDCLSEAQAELIAELYVEKIEDIIRDSGKQQIVGELRQIGNEEKSIFEEQDSDVWAQAIANVEPCLLPSMVGVDLTLGEATGVHAVVQYSVPQPAKLLQFCKENDFDAPLIYQFVWAVVLRLYSSKSHPCFGTLDTPDAGHRLGHRVVNTEDATPIMEALRQLRNDSVAQSATWISAAKASKQSASDELPFNTLVYTKSGEEAATTATVNSLLSGGNVSAVLLNPAPLTRRSGLVKLYHSKSHSRDYVEAMINCFLHILTQLPTKARLSIADLDFVDDKSCARFEEWSAPMPKVFRCCAHDIILEQAVRQPSAPAVSAWDGSLDYSELIALSNQFALRLQSLGVGPNVFVACLFDKSMWAVVAQLSVMRAGGAFVSLDPTHAEERLRTLVGELQAPVVLCSASRFDIAERISEMAIAIEREELIDNSPMLDPATVMTAHTDPAYGVFTSGTTGTPKLTVVEHTALTVSASGWKDILGFSERARVFQFSAFTFDVAVMDVFFTLLNGGCVCMPSEADRMNDLAGAINRSGTTLMSQVPSLFATINPASVPTLQYLVSGGEKMSPAFMEQWKSRHVVNAYGPSESTVVATVSIKSDGSGELINNDGTDIGVPACGRAWVVDAENPNKLLPHGAIGELVLEGPNVGRGYLNNQAKTDHAFVKNLQWTSDVRLRPIFGGEVYRMYRTGDLARFATHGSLTFLTRNDTQVKLKGQRVELEEIEHHASRLAATDVLVDIVTPKENTMAAGLAAFFVSSVESGEPADSLLLPMTASRQKVVDGLRQGLPHVLPLYMVPTFYLPLSHIPRTTSSKLDRRGLQTMAAALTKDAMRPYTSTASVASDTPKTGLEPLLRGLWEKVMNLSAGSVTDNDSFFGLGGDSFAAMTLVSAAQAKGLSLTVADVFTHPTLVDMCHACQTNDPKQAERVMSTEPFSLIPAGASREEVLADASDVCDVNLEAIEDVYPCSPVQSGLITSSTTKPGAYVVRSIYRLADSVDLDKFQAAWQRTVDELAILRTRIVHTADAGFCQVVLRSSQIQWNYASHLPQQSDNVPALPKSEGDVLTDYTIVNTGSERFFAWSLHHAAYDGWSIGLMLRIAQEHYLDIASVHKTTPAPYSLFIDYLSKADSAASDEFWKTNLDGFNTPAFPRIKDTSRQIVAGSRQHNTMELPTISSTEVTLPVVIRAAWAMTIADQSEAADVCFGETLMARNINLPGVTTMAGPVLTTVPTRVQVNNKNTVVSLLQSINEHMIDVIPHQHAGVQRIRRLATSASTACDFQNLLVVQSDDQALEKSVWDFEDIQAGEEFFTHPLVVECKVAGSKIKTTAHHDEHVIAADKVNRLIGRFNFILKQLAELPKGSDITVGHIDLVGPSDKAQILEWNSNRIEPIEKTIHDLVFKQGVLQPKAEAICAWDGTLSYREMCDHAAVFAHYLVSLGLEKEMFVPVCMDKSAWMVVAILGVLAAGGAYVPLDPAHPASRHAEIIEDVGAKFVICLPKYTQRYASTVETVLPVDRSVFESMKTMSSERPLGRSASNNMAYALFTSGSTGKPKGIVTEHASFVTSVSAFAPVVHLNRGTRAFHFASLTFDAAVMEIWGTLIFGGCVCIPSEEDRLNDVAGAMSAMRIEWTFCTPSVASIIEPSSVPTLKTLVCGGEMISAEVINKWTPYVEVINGYGPTETSVFATLAKITPASEPACIGHGIRSTCTWVVDPDDHDRLTPVGSVGELALSGRALAREYLNNPEKTNAEFIDNPRWAAAFPTTTANRIYKTGDLVRYYPNGAIECLGRKDHQVKLHGQRMELGEIESRLSQMDSIRHAIVLLPKTGLIKKRLVAILAVNAGDKSLKSANECQLVDPSVMHAAKLPEVQASLEKQLPIYMVPQAWVVMPSLPMLVSGKIDRKQITAWIEQLDKPNYERIMKDYDNIKRGKVPVPETKPVETGVSTSDVLRDVCAQVLNLEAAELDMQRSFLSLGTCTINMPFFQSTNISFQVATVSLVWQWSQRPESRVLPSVSKTLSRPTLLRSLQRERLSQTTRRNNKLDVLVQLLALTSPCRLFKTCTSSMLPTDTRAPADSTKASLSASPAGSTAQRSEKLFRPSCYATACLELDSAKTAMALGSNALQG
jgi:amino acid adenylation domain-containing protein/non-ribosomal peptide synthase protein (TIGR01720 family)